jgi:hypothetical protein
MMKNSPQPTADSHRRSSIVLRPWNDLAKLVRLTRDLPGFLRSPLSLAKAEAMIRHRLSSREARFIGMARRAIYGQPSSPYLQLLQAVGCELGDLEALVTGDGLEGALARLLEKDVYLTFDEFKGRREVVRGSRRFDFGAGHFDNPAIAPHIEAFSGGTRGPATPVKMALPYFVDLAANTAIAFQVHGLFEHEHVVWLQFFTPGLTYAGLGRLPPAWYQPVWVPSLRLRAASWYMALLGRLCGRPLPGPLFLDLRQPGRLVDWVARRRREGKLVCVSTYASSAVRVCSEAQRKGTPLDGVCFVTLGEPFTEAKKAAVEAAGARALVRFAFTEAGIIGYACGQPRASDDVHFFSDSYGLIQRSRPVGDSDVTVDAFLFTSLLETAPKIMLNVESGDYGLLEKRDCGCAFGALGLRDHITEIRSFEKLTGEGVTFVHTKVLRVLEEMLPRRFGGTSADYQLLEEEGHQGIVHLVLIVSPAIGPADEQELCRVFLEELGKGGPMDHEMAQVWSRAGTVQVRRQQPLATRAGKILPFHLHQSAQPHTRSS